MNELVLNLTEKYAGLWQQSKTIFQASERVFLKEEKKLNERKFEELLKKLELNNLSDSNKKNADFFENNLISPVENFLNSTLMLPQKLSESFSFKMFFNITKEFFTKSKEFDPALSNDDIYQACRNLWIMNILQLMSGREAEITPSVFAYSLLYPYCDNFVDDPKVSLEEKKTFSMHLLKKLKGENINYANELEKIIFTLIEMIEGEYDRECYPQIYDSLLEIHKAQVNSLSAQYNQTGFSKEELVMVNAQKGGASVLADGYLIAGNLTESQIDYVFGIGVYLQFMDDMQDINDDINLGIRSVFSVGGKEKLLDEYAVKTLNFGNDVMKCTGCFGTGNEDALSVLLKEGSYLILAGLMGLTDKYYSKDYIKSVETIVPFSFKYLKKNYAKVSKQFMQIFDLIGKAEDEKKYAFTAKEKISIFNSLQNKFMFSR